ncbi:hypothetical protein GEMRC1_007869 [Eukaryota sp. GEM-RC1]
MGLLHFLVIVVVVVAIPCQCPDDNCDSYRHSLPSCHCFCQTVANDLHLSASDAICTYIPPSHLSSGRCLFCSYKLKHAPQFPHSLIFGSHSSLPMTDMNGHIHFPIHHCFCPLSDCTKYSGSRQDCHSFGDSHSESFVNGRYYMIFHSRSRRSNGSCSICGLVDSCLL